MNKHQHAVTAVSAAFKSKRHTSSYSKAFGFSLIEVLVSIVVLSFGLLGMVGLQAMALQANRDSRIQSSAVSMARELGELMRSNKGIGIISTPADNPYLIDFEKSRGDAIPAALINCFTSACSTSDKLETAKFEVRDWVTRLDKELPGAKVKVCFDSTPFDSSGLPQWDCTDTGGLAVIKIGWTKASTKRSKINSVTGIEEASFERATDPSVVLPVTAGSST